MASTASGLQLVSTLVAAGTTTFTADCGVDAAPAPVTLQFSDATAALPNTVNILVGKLTISNQVNAFLALDNLAFVTGLVEVVGNPGTGGLSLSLNILRRAGAVEVGRGSAPNESTTLTLGLNKLQSVGGGLQVQSNNTLNSLSLTALQSVGGGLQVQNNDALGTLNLTALQSVGGGLNISGNVILLSVDSRRLQTVVEGVQLNGNGNGNTQYRFDALTRIGGVFEVRNHIAGLDRLCLSDGLVVAVDVGEDVSIGNNGGDNDLVACSVDCHVTDPGVVFSSTCSNEAAQCGLIAASCQ